MGKEIVFIEPPYGWNAEQLDPSFPLMYLAGTAEKCDWKAQIIDMQTLEDPLPKADVYAVSATSPQWIDAVKLSHRLMQEHPESLRIVGGNHISYDLCLGMSTEFNVCVAGEGEQILEEILQNPQKWITHKPIGIRADPIENLDAIPFPGKTLNRLETVQTWNILGQRIISASRWPDSIAWMQWRLRLLRFMGDTWT